MSMPVSDTASVAEQRPGPRSPFSKISGALGFAHKPRWISDFRIELDRKDPNHYYYPSDVIRGTIFFTPRKAVKITHITVSLYGYVHVFKSYNAPGDVVNKDSLNADPNKLLAVPGVVPLFAPVEETLFGDVKLEPCRGQFQFALRLPAHRLPSSIDFERGSIQYNLIATITRPHLTNPVIRSDPKKFMVHENIDCGKIPTPKPRVVTLEAVEKRKRRKKTPSLTISADKFGAIATVAEEPEPSSPRSSIAPSTDGSHHSNEATTMSNSSSSVELRIVPVASNSVNSPPSNSTNNSQNGSQSGSQNGSHKPTPRGNSNTKTITASAEIGRGAFLPGDSIPVRIQVAHIKPVKSMCGLIVTLYRKTHIETEPLVHQKVKDENGNITLKPITADVYPKSMSGFGGLSMSNKQTSHTFRMDVAQAHVPLFVDPHTLKADIKTRLEIPAEHVHPTITHVRGDTLDFRYYVEVCLDVQGKLEETRLLPRLTNQAVHGLGKPSARGSPSVPMSLASQGQQMIDTQTIKRERPQLVHWTFHVVIGTKDSSRDSRSSGKSNGQHAGVDRWQNVDLRMQNQVSTQGSECSRGSKLGDVQEEGSEELRALSSRGTGSANNGTRHRSPLYSESDPQPQPSHWDYSGAFEGNSSGPHQYSTPPPPPPPLNFASEPMDEKARLKQQERLLLPSAPDLNDEGSSSMVDHAPSAPPADELDAAHGARWETTTGAQHVVEHSGQTSGSRQRPALQRSQTHEEHESAERSTILMARHASSSSHLYGRAENGTPTLPVVSSRPFSDFDFSLNDQHGPPLPATEDKQELERRRLHELRSAPDYDDSEVHSHAGQTANVPFVPNEDDHQAAFGEWANSQEGLPKYENLD